MPDSDSTPSDALAELARLAAIARRKFKREYRRIDGFLEVHTHEGSVEGRRVREPQAVKDERVRQSARQRAREARQRMLEEIGDPTVCGVCGKEFGPIGDRDPRCVDHRHDNDVIRGIVCGTCNMKLGVIDLRFTDPDLFARLMAWSLRGQPAVPTGRKRGNIKRLASHPTLFDQRKQSM